MGSVGVLRNRITSVDQGNSYSLVIGTEGLPELEPTQTAHIPENLPDHDT